MEEKFWKKIQVFLSLKHLYRSSHFLPDFVSWERLDRVFRDISLCLDYFCRTFKVVTGDWYEGEISKKILVVPLGESHRSNYHR